MARTSEQIGLVSCVAFAVGTMIGAGVFVLTGPAIGDAGPAALVSFAIAGVSVLLSALAFAAVGSLAPPGGSGYAYVGVALGRYWGFLTSWAFYLSGVIGAAFVLSAFGTYTHQFFAAGVPALVVAVLGAVALTLLNLGPASAVGRAETALVATKVAILLLLIVFGLLHVGDVRWTPFAPRGWSPVLHQSGQLFMAYLGFSVVTSMAGDVKNARRTVPLAILISMLVVALVYGGVVVALLASGVPTYDEASVGTAAQALMGRWGGVLIPVGALISTLSSANANILGSSEVMVRLAADREVPTFMGRLWHGHPAVSVIAGGALYLVLIVSGNTSAVVSLADVAAICMMLLVNAAAFRAMRAPPQRAPAHGLGGAAHREGDPDSEASPPGMRLPLGPVLPGLGFATALVQLALIGWRETLVGLGLVFAGSGIYWLKVRFHHPAHHEELVAHLARNNGPASRAMRA